jgi:hypothetical protein
MKEVFIFIKVSLCLEEPAVLNQFGRTLWRGSGGRGVLNYLIGRMKRSFVHLSPTFNF